MIGSSPRGKLIEWTLRLAPYLLVLATTLVGIFDHDLWTPDEPRAAEISREFLEPGHSWAVPTLNGEPFVEKPPLVYWLAAASMEVFGARAWAARIPCLLFGWGTLLFTYLLGRRLYGDPVGRGALLVLATSVGFQLVSHHLESDTGLFFFVTGAAYFLHRAVTGRATAYVSFYVFLLGAFFSKGPIALVFVGLLFIVWIALRRSWSEIARAEPWFGITAIAVPIVLWCVALREDPRGSLLKTFLIDNHLDRFLPGREADLTGHRRPIHYYLLHLPLQFAPWIAVLALAIRWLRNRLREDADRFLISWFVPGFLFLSAASTKRGIYLMPLLPPLAILAAHWLQANGHGRKAVVAASALAAAGIAAALVLVPRIDEKKSIRPFGERLARLARPATRIAAIDPDETTRAVVPFYTGRRLEVIRPDADLEGLSKGPWEMTIVVVGKRTDGPLERVLQFFPHRWVEPASGDPRRMWALSNVPR